MAKGQESKNAIFNKLKEVYPNSFWEDEGKILRVPLMENGDRIEIKVQLTAAKNNLGEGVEGAIGSSNTNCFVASPTPAKELEVTPEEKENVEKLLKSLGL